MIKRALAGLRSLTSKTVEAVQGVPLIPRKNVPAVIGSEEVGTLGPSDWLGEPFHAGARIVYQSETAERVRQVVLARVEDVRPDGLTVEVIRRSKTGKPTKSRVELNANGMANATVYSAFSY